jgi:peptide-methionine (R)-S-oxide reductase
MTRRNFLNTLGSLAALSAVGPACATSEQGLGQLGKPAAFWKPLLAADAFGVLFHEDTERPSSSALNHEKRKGTFTCAACYLPLFTSDMKYDSGTGWPSFFKTLPNAVGTKSDRSLFTQRTEYHCARCGGHQGHMFDDGPQPTGQRFCNNGLALKFVPEGESLPALRG